MGNKCGQCSQIYTSACQEIIQCQVHNGPCFSCKKCSLLCPDDQPSKCSLCQRNCPFSDLYYQFNCNKLICRKHFLNNKDIQQLTFKMPCCQYKEMTEHILNFLVGYCTFCGRKLQNKGNPYQIGVCQPCEKKGVTLGQKQQKPAIEKQCCEGNRVEKFEKYCGQKQSKCQSTDQLFNDTKSSSSLLYQQKIEDLQKRIGQLRNQNIVCNQTRKQFKKQLMEESRDKDCLICYEQFNLTDKKPMMVCLEQHLICLYCFNTKNISVCPLCRIVINRGQIRASRERSKTLVLEQIVTKKYKQRLDQYLSKDRQILPPQVKNYKSVEVQTELQQPPEKGTKRRKNGAENIPKATKKTKTMES